MGILVVELREKSTGFLVYQYRNFLATFIFIIIFRGVSCYYCVAIYVSNDYTKFSVGARRLHDIGKTGWWQLLNFVPFGSVVLLVFFIIESEENDNQYGPNPHSDLKKRFNKLI